MAAAEWPLAGTGGRTRRGAEAAWVWTQDEERNGEVRGVNEEEKRGLVSLYINCILYRVNTHFLAPISMYQHGWSQPAEKLTWGRIGGWEAVTWFDG